ncbi:MAG TPA: ATP-dependent 6-phosphofructokinase [Firmicutes bacterium]|nr:ATP-dependent 6-phosphofructokinase [Bacillota bacterium]
MKEIKRIGILTCGGDCPGLNSVIRAVTKCAIVEYGLEVFGIYDSFDGLLGIPKARRLKMDDVKGLLFRGGTVLGSTNKGDPFEYRRIVCGKVIVEDLSDEVVQNIERLGLDALVVIGGDGTMAIANKFVERKGVPIVGVPKTIDNDIPETDRTFGFDTAVAIATEAIDRLQTTASSHHRILVVETMGRNAGWIALEAGLAGGADIILIPEIPFKIEAIVAAIDERERYGRRSTIICVAEGARPVGGEQFVERIVKDSAEPIRLGGIARWLCDVLEGKVRAECRAIVLGHIQRGGTPTASDRVLCTRLGVEAVNALVRGETGTMVVVRNNEIGTVPIARIAGRQKLVDPESDIVRAARATAVSFGDGFETCQADHREEKFAGTPG